MWAALAALAPGGATPDPNTPLCTDPAAIASWAQPGAIGDQSCHPDPTVAEMVGAPDFPHALAQIVKSVSTFWIGLPSPEVADASGQVSGVSAWLMHSVAFYTAALMILSIIVQAARMAWKGRADGFSDLVTSLTRYVLISATGAAIVSTALAVGDAFSTWIIDAASGGTDFGKNLQQLMGGGMMLGDLGAILSFIVLGLSVIVSVIMLLLLLVRGGVLILLVGTWPLSASMAGLQSGREWYSKQTAWLIAFIAFKPAAAIVYATAFALMGTPLANADATVSILRGAVFMIAAILTLPALVKLASHHTAPMASGKGAGATAAGAASLVVASGVRR